MGRMRSAAAAHVLDALLAMVERVDRARRRIRPVRPGALLGIERARHRGPAVHLGDGTRVGPGQPLAVLHLDNRELRRLGARDWQTRALAVAERDLAALARWADGQPAARRPVAYRGVTLLAPFARRCGFEIRPRPESVRQRLENWYLRMLLGRWAPEGRARLKRGRRRRAAEAWLSAAALRSRAGQASPAEGQ